MCELNMFNIIGKNKWIAISSSFCFLLIEEIKTKFKSANLTWLGCLLKFN